MRRARDGLQELGDLIAAHLSVLQITAYRTTRDAHRSGTPIATFTQDEAPYGRGIDLRDIDGGRAKSVSEESADNQPTLPSRGLRQARDITHIGIERGQFLTQSILLVGGLNGPLGLQQSQQVANGGP